MSNIVFYRYGRTNATDYAVSSLADMGYSFCPSPGEEITHLLLPVPSFDPDGTVKGSGRLEPLLQRLPENVTIIGGNLNHPALTGLSTIDLLKDPKYIASNASITAHCALKIALMSLPSTITENDILIIGWGRIGKCLAGLLKNMGSKVTVAARKETDRAMLHALGYRAIDTNNIPANQFDIIFNTAPELLLPQCSSNALMIDLASKPGITGEHVIIARGLPAKEAPASSGRLIANTIHRILEGKADVI